MTPTPIILDCDPGHDDAIALMLALASPEVELVGVTTVAGNQTLEKTTANALRVLEFVRPRRRARRRGRRPIRSSAQRDVAAHVHGESGLDGPDLPPPAGSPSTSTRSSSSHGRSGSGREAHARPDRPADERRAPARARARRAPGADRPDGRLGRRGQPHAGGRVQHLGRPRGRAARVRERDRRDDDRPRRHPPGARDRRRRRRAARRRARRQGRRRAARLLRPLAPRARTPTSTARRCTTRSPSRT